MPQEEINELAKFKAPFGQEVTLHDIMHESGLQMIRIRIKEGSRFTIFDIDQKTALNWGKVFENWARKVNNN